jgi:hypothetical protein
VCHAVRRDDLRGVVEKDRIGQGTGGEERSTRAEHHGNKIDDDLVDEAEPQCLTSDLATGYIDDPVAGVLPGGTDGLHDAVDERERRGVGVLPVRRWFVGDHKERARRRQACRPAGRPEGTPARSLRRAAECRGHRPRPWPARRRIRGRR